MSRLSLGEGESKAGRLCAEEFDKELLVGLEVLPNSMKKAAAHGTMKAKLRELPSPECLPFQEVMDEGSKEAVKYPQANFDSEDENEYAPSAAGRAEEDERIPKKARTDGGPGSAEGDLMNISVLKGTKTLDLESREGQPSKRYKRSEDGAERAKRQELRLPILAGHINIRQRGRRQQ